MVTPISDKKRQANNRNSKLSTGPKTDAGKAIARCNALAHGYKALILSVYENSQEVEAARTDWNRSLNPKTPWDYKLCDHSFQLCRLFDGLILAETATQAERIRDVHGIHIATRQAEALQTIQMLQEGDIAPDTARKHLVYSTIGLDLIDAMFLDLLGQMSNGLWSTQHEARLMNIQGLSAEELPKERANRVLTLDKFQTLEATLADPELLQPKPPDVVRLGGALQDLSNPLYPMLQAQYQEALERWSVKLAMLRHQYTVDLEAWRPRAELAKNEIRCEVVKARVANNDLYEAARQRDADDLALARERARFDPTEEGRLRRRYLGEAHRAFLKALKAAQDATAIHLDQPAYEPLETPEIIEPKAEPAPVPAPEPPPETPPANSPNEPTAPPAEVVQTSKIVDAPISDRADGVAYEASPQATDSPPPIG